MYFSCLMMPFDIFKVYFLETGMVELFVRRASGDSSCADIVGLNGEALTRISKVSSGGVFGDASFFLSKTYRYYI